VGFLKDCHLPLFNYQREAWPLELDCNSVKARGFANTDSAFAKLSKGFFISSSTKTTGPTALRLGD